MAGGLLRKTSLWLSLGWVKKPRWRVPKHWHLVCSLHSQTKSRGPKCRMRGDRRRSWYTQPRASRGKLLKVGSDVVPMRKNLTDAYRIGIPLARHPREPSPIDEATS